MAFPARSLVSAPDSEKELMERVLTIAGLRLGQLADASQLVVPVNPLRAKGWVGQLLEYYLGADAGVSAEPDFTTLGIELKTIPINRFGKPLETTYVSVAPLKHVPGLQWQNSLVYRKLKRVLWVPILSEDAQGKALSLEDRTIGNGFLWSASPVQAEILQKDFEELIDMIALGQLEKITARHGQYLQIRPKAASAKSLTLGVDYLGRKIATLPRGFYLRTRLTHDILQKQFMLSD